MIDNDIAKNEDKTLTGAESNKEVKIKAFLYNKKERYEWQVRETGRDSRIDEVKGIIEKITKSEDKMYERRKNIRGFDFIMAEGKVPILLREAIDSYILGNFFSTIAVCGMTAERLCYDFIDFVDIRIGEKLLSHEEKTALYKLPFNGMIDFFWKIGSLDKYTKDLLYQILDLRNRYVHPAMSQEQQAEDAMKILNLLCEVLEEKLSLFQFYDIKDGMFVLKR
jgi:hypothetical protein